MEIKEVKELLMEDLKDAIKEKDLVIKAVISVVNAKLSDGMKQAHLKGEKFTKDNIIGIFSNELKQINETLDSAIKGGREDMINAAKLQIKFLEKYLPKQLSKDEIQEVIINIINEDMDLDINQLTKKDMGKIVKEVTPRLKGRASGKLISSVIGELINRC